MEYVGDEAGAAPPLHAVSLDLDEARRLFARLLDDIDLMLLHNRIHGDLSAFNVLYWNGAVRIIDFPQVVSARGNPDAYALLQRDLTRLCAYFTRCGLALDPAVITANLWARHNLGPAGPVPDPARFLDEEAPGDDDGTGPQPSSILHLPSTAL
jgi:RIO kinase 1